MIITRDSFLNEAKKYKKGFKIREVMSGSTPCYEVTCLLIPSRLLDYSKLLLTKESRPRVAWQHDPAGEYKGVVGNSHDETLDSLFQTTLELLGKLDIARLDEELIPRIRLMYIGTDLFLSLIRKKLKTLSAAEQKTFVRDNGIEHKLMKCPITKQWEFMDYSAYLYLDGKRKTVSGNGWKKAKETHEVEEFDGNIYLWTKGEMPMYTINGNLRISLYNLINSDHVTECEDCGSLNIGQEICQTCYPGVTVGSLMQTYSSKAENVFSFKQKKEDGKTPLYLGVELELEDRTSKNLLETWKKLKDHAIIKHDGSVSNGLEICSAPATLGVHKEEFKSFFDVVDKIGLKSKANCGMHVHVDRASLTELQIGKIISFFYNKGNKSFINKIAGRKDNNYCSLEHERNISSGVYYEGSSELPYSKRLVRSADVGRYTGINTAPKKTIEFRIFATTTSYEVFLKNLEFVQSMIDFTRPSAVVVKSIKDYAEKNTYLNFVKNNRKSYPNLYQFLKADFN